MGKARDSTRIPALHMSPMPGRGCADVLGTPAMLDSLPYATIRGRGSRPSRTGADAIGVAHARTNDVAVTVFPGSHDEWKRAGASAATESDRILPRKGRCIRWKRF